MPGRRACWPHNHTSVDASGVKEGDSGSAPDPYLCAGGHRERAHPRTSQWAQQRLEEKARTEAEGTRPWHLAALTLERTSP